MMKLQLEMTKSMLKYYQVIINAVRSIIDYCKNNGYTFEAITDATTPVRFK